MISKPVDTGRFSFSILRNYSDHTDKLGFAELMDNGEWKMENVAQRSKSFRKCLCLRANFILHFPFSIHPDKSPYTGED